MNSKYNLQTQYFKDDLVNFDQMLFLGIGSYLDIGTSDCAHSLLDAEAIDEEKNYE